jgi:hypothetical protein
MGKSLPLVKNTNMNKELKLETIFSILKFCNRLKYVENISTNIMIKDP